MELLLDTDATINLRSLGVLEILIASDLDLVWTGYVFENELSNLQGELGPLRESGRLIVEAVLARTPAHRLFKKLRRAGADKGEAEAIAWSRSTPETRGGRFFVSDDKLARRTAGDDPCAITSAECIALLVVMGQLERDQARELLVVWDDQSKQHGRPKRWQSFDADFSDLVHKIEHRFAHMIT